MRDSFIFYRSFNDALKKLPAKDQLGLFRAIVDYSLDGIEPKNLSLVSECVFTAIKPVLLANTKRYENGKKGGAPKGNSNNPNGRKGKKKGNETNQELTKNQPRTNQELTKNQPNKDKDVDLNLDKDLNNTSLSLSLSENERDDEFERFWEMYGKKQDRKKCETKFKKLSKADKAKIFETLQAYVDSTPDEQYRKNPLTYLNGECWNNEIIQRNGKQNATAANRQSADHSWYRDPTRHYETISDF